jgi:hypothetical protein
MLDLANDSFILPAESMIYLFMTGAGMGHTPVPRTYIHTNTQKWKIKVLTTYTAHKNDTFLECDVTYWYTYIYAFDLPHTKCLTHFMKQV